VPGTFLRARREKKFNLFDENLDGNIITRVAPVLECFCSSALRPVATLNETSNGGLAGFAGCRGALMARSVPRHFRYSCGSWSMSGGWIARYVDFEVSPSRSKLSATSGDDFAGNQTAGARRARERTRSHCGRSLPANARAGSIELPMRCRCPRAKCCQRLTGGGLCADRLRDGRSLLMLVLLDHE
jgi:hypothetical protein